MAGKNSDLNTLAFRYAAALIEKAEEDGVLAAVENDIATLYTMLWQIDDFAKFIHNPLIDRRRQREAILTLAGKAKFHRLTVNFLGVLAINGRLGFLDKITVTFFEETSRRRGEVKADVETAFPLTSEQERAIAGELAAALGFNVVLNVKVNKDLIGGLRIIVGSKMIDNTVSRKLERLQKVLGGSPVKQLEGVA